MMDKTTREIADIDKTGEGGGKSGVPGLASYWVRLALNGTNVGLVQIRFQ